MVMMPQEIPSFVANQRRKANAKDQEKMPEKKKSSTIRDSVLFLCFLCCPLFFCAVGYYHGWSVGVSCHKLNFLPNENGFEGLGKARFAITPGMVREWWYLPVTSTRASVNRAVQGLYRLVQCDRGSVPSSFYSFYLFSTLFRFFFKLSIFQRTDIWYISMDQYHISQSLIGIVPIHRITNLEVKCSANLLLLQTFWGKEDQTISQPSYIYLLEL